MAAKTMEQDAPEVRKAIATFREYGGILGMANALLAGRALSNAIRHARRWPS
jgi:hypothetical protein